MAKSLNPHAAGHAAPPPPPAAAPRRNVLVACLAAICAAVVGLFPFGAGLLVFLDPILKRKQNSQGGEDQRPFRRVASAAALPADGTPVQVPVIADLTDAWNREPNQPVGAVYLRKSAQGVECFNAICPHAGCFVGYAADRKVFQCPCHTSSFQLTGQRILPSPSPRDMDALKVDEAKLQEGEVWVQFVNYYPGKPDREEKP
ncbi:MAG TPA: Rieske 2Fe-2S domain-containing protein [Pirellulaceae bacterium]|nr:Rieske 2Fe-2S domain-containing protein [Pirellulaceae bacterium]